MPFLTGPLVEMGLAVVVVCAVATRSAAGLFVESWVGVGDGDVVVSALGGVIGVAGVCALAIGVAGSGAVFGVEAVRAFSWCVER